LVGVCTYGTPPSAPLRKGIAGEKHKSEILELNRLVLSDNLKNEASNFLYTGLSAKRTDWKIRGKEHLHGVTVADEFRHIPGPGRAKMLREKYGDDFYLKPRPRKHRYLYILGSKSYKKSILSDMKYKIKDYPKHDVSDGIMAGDSLPKATP
jgi:hypothetical protein